MTSPRSRENAEHYVWGNGCDGWHLVRTPELGVIEERMPPGTTEERHRHAKSRQLFYVLRGRLTMELDGVLLTLTQGQSIEVAPGCVHQAMNDSDQDTEFLLVSQPHSHGDRERVD